MFRLLWRNISYRLIEWLEDKPLLKVDLTEVNREYR